MGIQSTKHRKLSCGSSYGCLHQPSTQPIDITKLTAVGPYNRGAMHLVQNKAQLLLFCTDQYSVQHMSATDVTHYKQVVYHQLVSYVFQPCFCPCISHQKTCLDAACMLTKSWPLTDLKVRPGHCKEHESNQKGSPGQYMRPW